MIKKIDLLFYTFIIITLLFMIFNENLQYANIKSFFQLPVKPLIKTIDFIKTSVNIKYQYKIILEQYGNYMLKYRINKNIEKENEILRNMLYINNKEEMNLVACEVIGGDIVNNSYFIINKGKNAGIKEDMPAMYFEGIVGKVIEVGFNTSFIETYNNINFKIGITDKEHSFYAVAKNYKNNVLIANDILLNSNINKNDTIYTSGLGKIYPADFPIGIIENIDTMENTYKRIYIKPINSITGLKFIFIIKRKSNPIFSNSNIKTKNIGQIGWFTVKEKVK